MKTESEIIEIIDSGEDSSYDILYDADKKLITRFHKIDKAIVELLKDVQKHFPDAEYYTASGGFHLMLGSANDSNGYPQSELIACSGNASIGDVVFNEQ